MSAGHTRGGDFVHVDPAAKSASRQPKGMIERGELERDMRHDSRVATVTKRWPRLAITKTAHAEHKKPHGLTLRLHGKFTAASFAAASVTRAINRKVEDV